MSLRNTEWAATASRDALLCGALLITVSLAYAPVLRAPFLWDDLTLILGSPLVREAPLERHFLEPFWGRSGSGSVIGGYYRPLTTLSYALQLRISGASPFAFHLANLLLHLFVTACLFLLARKAGAGPFAAVSCVALWALMPRLTEAVSWISGRTDLLAATFVLASLVAFGEAGVGWAVAAAAAFAGMLAKETAVAIVPAVVARSWAESKHNVPRRVIGACWPFAAALALLAAIRWHVLGTFVSHSEVSVARRAGLFFHAAGTYLLMVLDPFDPGVSIGSTDRIDPGHVVLGVIAVSTAVWGLRWLARNASTGAFAGGVLAVFALLPVLHVAPLPGKTVACDRYLYLPLAGMVIVVSTLRCGLGPAMRTAGRFLMAGLVLSLGIRTFVRNLDWGDEIRFWTREVQKAQTDKLLPRHELAAVLFRNLRFREAAMIWKGNLLTAGPGLPRESVRALEGSIALCLAEGGQDEQAIRIFRSLAAEDPGESGHLLNAARVEMQRFRFKEARAIAAEILKSRPTWGPAIALREEAERLDLLSPPLSHSAAGTSTETLATRARVIGRLGRRPGCLAWKEIAERSDAPPWALQEAAEFLLRSGPAEWASFAVDRFVRVAPGAAAQSLRQALSDRMKREHALDGAAEVAGLRVKPSQKTAGSS